MVKIDFFDERAYKKQSANRWEKVRKNIAGRPQGP